MASEKYQAYLCSREWGLLREAVIERSGGVCERCKRNPGTAVHHLTYARVYRERLTDLIHVCDGCHDFSHGRGHVDPAVVELELVRIYMAGAVRMEGDSMFIDCWRDEIFSSSCKHGGVQEVGRGGAVSGRFLYGGPTIASGGGHTLANEEKDAHLAERCLVQVALCDVVIAWIDRKETVGTIAEIAAARALHIPIFVAYENLDLAQHFYFVSQLADACVIAATFKDAWASFLGWCEEENRSWWHREYEGLNRKRDKILWEKYDIIKSNVQSRGYGKPPVPEVLVLL